MNVNSFYYLMSIMFLLFLSTKGISQEYGLKLGGTASYLTGLENMEIKPGGQVGAFVKLGGEEVLYFKAELLLSQKGARAYGDDVEKVNLLFIDLPLMFGIVLSEALHLNIGFQPSMFLYGNYSSGGTDLNIDNSQPSGASEFDYSTLIGLEYKINDRILLGLRYNHSFVPIVKYNNSFFENEKSIISRVGQIYLGYRFRN